MYQMVFMSLQDHKKNATISTKTSNHRQLAPTRLKPLSLFQALAQKYGPIMLIHLGSKPTLLASSADVAREIMKTHDLSFSSRPSLPIPTILVYGSKDIVLSPYGDHWRNLKTILVTRLLNKKRVNSYRKVREEETSHMIGAVGERCGSLIDISVLLASLTNNIITRVALGRAYDGLKVTNLLKRFLNMLTIFTVGSYVPCLSWVDHASGVRRRAREIAKDFDEFLEDAITEHISKERETAMVQIDEEQDVVDTLLELRRDNTNDLPLHSNNLKDMFVGGSHTTFTTLEWTITELVRHPRVMKQLQQEVTKIAEGRLMILEDDLEKMKYLKAVIKETLRLHPPLPLLVPRESTQDVKLLGYDIPVGTQVLINVWAIGRDPAFWEKSYEFWLERFFNHSVEYNGLQFEWLPFGAGRRRCPGIQFGVLVIELAVANLIYKFDLTPPNRVKNDGLDTSPRL